MRARQGMAILCSACVAMSAPAQPAVMQEPTRPLALSVERPTLKLDVEGNRLRTTPADAAPATSESTTDWTPAVVLHADGSVYHPRFLEFNVDTENGMTRGKRRVDNGDGNAVTDNRDFSVGRYDASATLLRDKPVSATAFGHKHQDRRDYDQFNRFTADTESVGAGLRGSAPMWTWNVRGAHTDETTDQTDRPGSYREDMWSADAAMEHHGRGRTTMRATQQDYSRRYNGALADEGVQRTLFVWDESGPATNANTRLLSSVNVSDLSQSPNDTRSFTAREDFRQEHRDNLWSGATYQYDQRNTAGATFQQNDADLYVEHQLYQNLDSRLDLRGQYSDGDHEHESRLGPGASEIYTRHLGDIGRIGADIDYRVERIDRHVTSASSTVVGEALRLDDQNPAILSLPDVAPGSIVVRDAGGARQYLENFDYRVVRRGSFTEIQRIFGGAIPAGSTVLVDYTAASGGSDSLYRAERGNGVDLDLYDRRLFLYARQRAADSFGGSTSVFENYREDVLGARTTWSWCEVGMEHVNHVADTLSYAGVNTYADLYWDGDSVSARLHNGYSTSDYRDQPGGLDVRTHTATVDWTPLGLVTVQGFAGRYDEDTHTSRREMTTLEARLLFHLSQLMADCTYRIEDEKLDAERRERRYVLVRISRDM